MLSKDDFLELDEATLDDIRTTAAYNTACTKEPLARSEADLDLLQRRGWLKVHATLPCYLEDSAPSARLVA